MTDDELTSKLQLLSNMDESLHRAIIVALESGGPRHLADLARAVKDVVYDASGWDYNQFADQLYGLVFTHEVEPVGPNHFQVPQHDGQHVKELESSS